ncbi:MAG: tetratricopeptide repeat protein [Bacteroidota bacterium]
MNTYSILIRGYFLLPLLLLANIDLAGQDMTKGFRQLETGEFESAKAFFKDVLKKSPENKTALICYGRAVGLSGNPEVSLGIFNDLNRKYARDQEVLLNLAEAQLWGKQPLKAIPVYKSLLETDDQLFAAWLGLANSYSMAGKYEQAYETIKEAIVLDPQNGQAKISRKYIILGYANYFGSDQQDFERALALLDENLANDAEDQDSRMLQGSMMMRAKKYEEALASFSKLKSKTNSLMQQSLVLHLSGKNQEEAYQLADSANRIPVGDPQKKMAVRLHLLNALLWNSELKKAKEYHQSLTDEYGEKASVLFAGAQLSMYDADFEKGVEDYRAGLTREERSFAGNLGIADAFHALKLDSKSYDAAFRSEEIFENQPDVLAFIKKLNDSHSPEVHGAYVLSGSSDGSYNRAYRTGGSLSITPELKVGVDYENKKYRMQGSDAYSEKEVFGVYSSYQFNSMVNFESEIKLLRNNIEGITSSNYLMRMMAKLRINKLLGISTGYKSELLDFNNALFSRQLRADHLFLQSNFYIAQSGIGNYTELMKSFLSDGNQRTLLFTSVYQNIGKKKYLKTGVNYLHITFNESRPTDYFSPLKHQQVEVFAGFTYSIKSKYPTKLQAESAYGFQWNTDVEEFSLRAKLSVIQQYKQFRLEVFGQYSTAANDTFNGFNFHEYGVKLRVQLTGKPVFYKKIKDNYDNK